MRDAEYQTFAEQFVDLLVDPKQRWFVRYIVMGGLDHIPTDGEIDSGDFALRVRYAEKYSFGISQSLSERDRDDMARSYVPKTLSAERGKRNGKKALKAA